VKGESVGSLQFAVCSLQFAMGSLQFAVCSGQFAVGSGPKTKKTNKPKKPIHLSTYQPNNAIRRRSRWNKMP
jgi:hypothetical protein